MEYSFISDQLTQFLSGKEIIREVKGSSKIISFAVPVTLNFSVNPDHLSKFHKYLFYFNKPSDQFSFAAAGELTSVTENGNGRFHAIEKKVKEIKSKLISNWEYTGLPVPLFSGGMKFTAEHNDPDWKDFNDSNWIIPELIYLSCSKGNYFILNFFYTRTSVIDEIVNSFETKIKQFMVVEDTNRNSSPGIRSSSGQTVKDKKKWKNMIQRALSEIDDSKVAKVVLSRRVEISLNREPSFNFIIDKLITNYPECGTFLFKNHSSVFFGASPERLICLQGNNILVDALAGSARNNQKQEELFSRKNVNEHDFVLNHIKNTISPFSENLELTQHHSIKKLNNISHIWSEISAKLREGHPFFPVVKELFPTPAICGSPKEAALNVIKKLEDHRRGLYSGFIGWFNFSAAEFYVSIRSALSTGNKIIAYAGCGIVDGSDADDEFNETELKLIPILSLFKNENQTQPQHTLG